MKAADSLPEEYALEQSAPNPFSHSTEIRYDLPEPAHVRLAVYNQLGQEVRRLVDGEVGAGFHTVPFEAGDLPSGVYLYRITAARSTFWYTLPQNSIPICHLRCHTPITII